MVGRELSRINEKPLINTKKESEMPILSGMLFCADCGAKLYQVRARGWTHEQEHFVCATYRKIKGGCTSHQIHNVQVEEILLRDCGGSPLMPVSMRMTSCSW